MESFPRLSDLKGRVDHEQEIEDQDSDDLNDVPVQKEGS